MRIHLISIGGAVMHNLALALHTQGHTITGSDDEIFEPSLTRLHKEGLLPKMPGWQPENISKQLDLIILGMHARKDNPELQKAEELCIRVCSFPEYVFEQSLSKTRVVIAGSHGKTTTTAMVMHALRFHHYNFDYLVGSQLEGFEMMVSLSDAPLIIIEGDEYLTSPVDLKPKFHWYKPQIALITGIAWDHINVFPTFENYVDQFRIFINQLNPSDRLFIFEEDAELQKLSLNACCKVTTYGTPNYRSKDGLTVWLEKGKSYPLHIFGKHNLQNMSGANKICESLGMERWSFLEAMKSFQGTARRLEPIPTNSFLAAFRDFAHAPSKAAATVKAVKEQYPGKKLIAVFELHTYSSLQKKFLSLYKGSLDQADLAVIYCSPHVFELKKMPVLSHEEIIEGFGKKLEVMTERSQLEDFIQSVKSPDNILLLMSSGNFDGMSLVF
jgi:UDP-N-acetylmuramate: L-alanyl-gamma-D-glutamyl-meso-diaminopimelate ligase